MTNRRNNFKNVQSNLRTAKRAKTTHATNTSRRQPLKIPREFIKVRGRFAFLEGVISLPKELILEILSWLDPRDLLSLARTSKDLREILLSKSSQSIWLTARINFEGGLPALPQDLNEVQFARLIFDVHCHVCNKRFHCDKVLWKFRLRCCRTCEKSFPQASQLRLPPRAKAIFSILPREKITAGNIVRIIYDRRAVHELSRQYLGLNPEDRQSWVDQKRQELQAVEQNNMLASSRILTRLAAFGLDAEARSILSGQSEFEEASMLIKLCSLNQSKCLTDQDHNLFEGWNDIEFNVVEKLSIHKRKRLRQEHITVCRERYSQFKQVYFDIMQQQDLRNPFPGAGDLLTDPTLESLLWDTVTEEELTPTFLRSRILDELPRIQHNWRTTHVVELLQILKAIRHDATQDDLHLATTIFGCTSCNSLLIYSQVFSHRCCYNNRASGSSHNKMRAVNAFYDTVDQEGPWSSRTLFFHSPSSRLAERIVADAGLDPATTTTCDLTTAHPLIECTGHQAGFFPGRLFVTWQAALVHNLVLRDEVFFVVNRFGAESSAIRAAEPLNPFTSIHCAHCHEELTFNGLSCHLRTLHNVHNIFPTVTDIYQHFEAHWYWSPYDNLNVIGPGFATFSARYPCWWQIAIPDSACIRSVLVVIRVVVNVSYYYGFDDHPSHLRQTPAARAAALARGAMLFRKKLKQDWSKSFAVEGDDGNLGHIIVTRKNRVWKIDAAVDGQILSTDELEKQFEHIYKNSTHPRPGVGVLTASNRDVWAKDYAELATSEHNANILNAIHSSAFTICLEEGAPSSPEQKSRVLWHGHFLNGQAIGLQNRWVDKPCQFIVYDNMYAGFMGEHSIMDGTPTVRLCDEVLDAIADPSFDHGSELVSAPTSPPLPTPLDWEISATTA
ncbi:hypothetical protein FB446DRAFT_704251 [Lentinula raphanica]|nr:hypothetical protein FB446DRAFT_704251 [Lentinula raphanica]